VAFESHGVSAQPSSKTARLKSLPDFIEPQLCKLVERPPASGGWAHEIKFDGYRVQLRVQDGEARIRTRSGLDWTEQFSTIAKAAAALPDCIIDGEICAVDKNNMPSFAALQAALAEERSEGLVFFAFDLLIEGKEDCRALPLSTRKDRLKALLEEADAGATFRYVEHFNSTGNDVWLSACKMDLEGIVSKRLEAPYVSGRNGGWTKAKCRGGQEVVLGGWTTESGGLRSLLAGVHRDGRLEYVGASARASARKSRASFCPRSRSSRRGEPLQWQGCATEGTQCPMVEARARRRNRICADGRIPDDSSRVLQGFARDKAAGKSSTNHDAAAGAGTVA
jgi:bifunctional non-homologous end joining protein LigD